MLNPTFSRAANMSIRSPFVAPVNIAERTVDGNTAFDTGHEYRLQSVYGDEVWLKLAQAGLATRLSQNDVLEVCAGNGFLTYHLLSGCTPKSLTVNDISASEMEDANRLIASHYPNVAIEWALGDMHELEFGKTFDVVLGNSFLHHFHNVPQVLSRFASLLNPGGVFLSLHEPTPMASVLESAKVSTYPLAVLAPGFVNDIARARHNGEPSPTDIWLFEPHKLKKVALDAGFSRVETRPWNLFRPLAAQRNGLHLSAEKPALSQHEEDVLRRAIEMDARLNRFLPTRCFGSVCLVCRK